MCIRDSFSTTRVDGQFSLVYLVFNTIFNLQTQDEQVACFANAATHLVHGGHFVIELEVPNLQRLPPGQEVLVFHVDSHTMSFDTYDAVSYTHLDVYKRQAQRRARRGPGLG